MTTGGGKSGRDRREFFRGVARWSIMGGLAALAGWLAGRQSPASKVCKRATVCRGCPLLAECRLPRAAAQRRITAEFNGPRGRRDR